MSSTSGLMFVRECTVNVLTTWSVNQLSNRFSVIAGACASVGARLRMRVPKVQARRLGFDGSIVVLVVDPNEVVPTETVEPELELEKPPPEEPPLPLKNAVDVLED